MKTSVLIVDDHPLLRDGLRQALERAGDVTVVGQASTGAAAVQLALARKPDLIVMDLHLPDLSGVEATRQILAALPETKVVVFSGDAQREQVDAALQAGACGYILKKSVADELLQALRLVTVGKLYLSPEVGAIILEDYRKALTQEAAPAKPALSERDRQLLRLIAAGKRNKEIASDLQLSPNSIEKYRARLMKKLACASTAELVRYAIREGLATL
jgi:two-component system, NarL family, response regulator NreC